ARRTYADAALVGITGWADAEGSVVCSPSSPFQDGWTYSFFSPSQRQYLMVASCLGKLAGPVREMRDKNASPPAPIKGSFIDSDEAVGGALDAGLPEARGKRPFSLKLSVLEDPEYPRKPVLWTVGAGGKNMRLDAVHGGTLDPSRYGVDLEAAAERREKPLQERRLAARPKKKGVYTALADMDKVERFAQDKLRGSKLMAVEGFADAWGNSPCTSPSDGWSFYYHHPKRDDFAVVFACRGEVGMGPPATVPVDPSIHLPLSGKAVDSGAVLDELISRRDGVMNEGMGRTFSRIGTLRLVRFREPPFSGARTAEFWVLGIGMSQYTFEASSGRLVRAKD
ncbi:MAG: hypothetical protein AAB578_08985, partial [Elusimicrobiota bacterium]